MAILTTLDSGRVSVSSIPTGKPTSTGSGLSSGGTTGQQEVVAFKDENGIPLTGYNATLQYVAAGSGSGKAGKQRQYRFWLTNLDQTHSLAGEVRQSLLWQHFYARSYAPSLLSVQGRVRTQAQYDDLAEFVRAHQRQLVLQPGRNNADDSSLALMRLDIPSEGLYYAGWVKSFPGGAKRFNPAPPFTFQFEVINDRHSSNSNLVPSSAIRSVWSGQFLSGSVSQTTSKSVSDAVDKINNAELTAKIASGKAAAAEIGAKVG